MTKESLGTYCPEDNGDKSTLIHVMLGHGVIFLKAQKESEFFVFFDSFILLCFRLVFPFSSADLSANLSKFFYLPHRSEGVVVMERATRRKRGGLCKIISRSRGGGSKQFQGENIPTLVDKTMVSQLFWLFGKAIFPTATEGGGRNVTYGEQALFPFASIFGTANDFLFGLMIMRISRFILNVRLY